MTLTVDITHRVGTFDLNVTFDAPAGITALFGRSGAGKTMTINAIAGLLRPRSGRISLAGTDLFDATRRTCLPPHRRRLGYVFQDGRLFPHLSVRRNLTYGLRFARSAAGGSGEPTPDAVAALLGLGHLMERLPSRLSGGEQQRVAIGRALLSRPRMLLMDEPLAALDAARKAEILPYLERLRDETGIPILYVSHSMAEVARLAAYVIVLEQGRSVRAGPAEQILSDPAMVRQIGVRQAGAVLPARVRRHHADGLTELAISGGALFLPRVAGPENSTARVRILAHDVILARAAPADISTLNILQCEVLALLAGDGPGVIVQLRCGDDRLLARITRRSADAMGLAPGDRIVALIKSVSVAHTDVAAG